MDYPTTFAALLGALIGGGLTSVFKGWGEQLGKIIAVQANPGAIADEALNKKAGELDAIDQNPQIVAAEARMKKVGELDAVIQNLTIIAAQATTQKEGELKAIHSNLDNLVMEMQRVTKETEAIKSEISGDLWYRQTTWR